MDFFGLVPWPTVYDKGCSDGRGGGRVPNKWPQSTRVPISVGLRCAGSRENLSWTEMCWKQREGGALELQRPRLQDRVEVA